MLSFQLWRLLNTPQIPNPLTRRATSQLYAGLTSAQRTQKNKVTHRVRGGFLRIISWIALPVIAMLVAFPILLMLYVSTLSLAPLFIALANTVYGALLASSVATHIAHERETNTYDVLSTIPPGGIGVHVVYCVTWIRQNRFYFWFLIPFILIGMFGMLMGLGVDSIFPSTVEPQITFESAAQRIALLILYGYDVIHSFVAAALVGMLTPVYMPTRVNARFYAPLAYAALQITAYTSLFVFGSILTPLLTNISPILTLILPILMVAVVFAVREMAIALLWRDLAFHLNTNGAELASLSKRKL